MQNFKQLIERFVPNGGFRKQIMDQYEKDLVSFGNHLIKGSENDGVTDAQLSNWKFIESGETVEGEHVTVTNTPDLNTQVEFDSQLVKSEDKSKEEKKEEIIDKKSVKSESIKKSESKKNK